MVSLCRTSQGTHSQNISFLVGLQWPWRLPFLNEQFTQAVTVLFVHRLVFKPLSAISILSGYYSKLFPISSQLHIYLKAWIQVQDFKVHVYLRNNKNIVIIISRFVILEGANFSGLRITSGGCHCRSFALSRILHVIKTLVWYLPLFFRYPPMLEMTNTIKYLTCDRPISYKKLSIIQKYSLFPAY